MSCRVCGKWDRFETVTDIITGRATYLTIRCVHEDRLAGRLCCDCGEPHGGDWRRYRCPACVLVLKRKKGAEWQAEHVKRPGVKERLAERRRKPEVRERKVERERQRLAKMDPERRAKAEARHRAQDKARRGKWGAPKYEQTLAQKRDYYQRNRDAILARQRIYDRKKAA